MPADVPLEGRVNLAATARSAGLGRRFVRDLLERAGRDEWAEAAVLVVSELVTNAVLHAHSEVEVVGRVRSDHLRLEVRDDDPTLPSARSYDDQATTGRGLELVAAMTLTHGVESLGAVGKVVWCCVGDDPALADPSAGEPPADWAEAVDLTSAPPAGDPVSGAEVRTVVLQALPPTLWLAAQEHSDALLRELALLRSGGAVDDAGLPPDSPAADAARALLDRGVGAALEQARRSGTASVPLPDDHPGALPAVPVSLDLALQVRPEQAGDFAELQDVLDAGERLARADLLLLRPGLPEVVAVRDWACEQVIAQLGGTPPAPWPGTTDEGRAADVGGAARLSGWDDTPVRTATVGLIAVDDANRVVAVSEPLSRVLGWDADELVGRRVVAIVPARFREAHVSGFSRHLSTGRARALGVHLRLPVLCRDGAEVECQFLISAESAPGGRAVYVARITPVASLAAEADASGD